MFRRNIHDRVPSLTAADVTEDPRGLAEAVRRIREAVLVLQGARGDPRDKAVTPRDLMAWGVIDGTQSPEGDFTFIKAP